MHNLQVHGFPSRNMNMTRQVSLAQNPVRHLSLFWALSFLGLLVAPTIHASEMPVGRVVVWGQVHSSTPPPPSGVFSAVSAKSQWNLALRTNGTVFGWGSPSSRHPTPADLHDVISIEAGDQYSLALLTNGTVVSWGNGQAVPDNLNGVKAIAAGNNFSLALRTNGTVVGWGSGTYGESIPPNGLNGVVAIAAGRSYGMALRDNGTVIAWGWLQPLNEPPVPAGLSGVTAIAAGGDHRLALKSDGTIVAWGNNEFGQTVVPENLNNVVAIAAGNGHSLALKADGTVVAWGDNQGGQCNVPAGLNNVIAIAGGHLHSLALVAEPAVPAVVNISFTEGQPALALTGDADRLYSLEYSEALPGSLWTSLTNFTPPQTYLDSPTPPAPQRFYRIRLLP